jgi:hypothetical protein
MKQETMEYDLLQHIKFCLECKNESQAIRMIEQYGFEMQEQNKKLYSEEEVRDIAEASFSFYKTNEFSDDELEVEWRNWLEKRTTQIKKK